MVTIAVLLDRSDEVGLCMRRRCEKAAPRPRTNRLAMYVLPLLLSVGLAGCGGTAATSTSNVAAPTSTTVAFAEPSTPSTTIEASITSTSIATTTSATTTTTTLPATTVPTCRVSVPDPDAGGYFTVGFSSNQPGAAVALRAISARVFSATTNESGAASMRFSLGQLEPGRTINFVATVGAASCSTTYTTK
jgi:hypothetical protein